jgi:hypothetical protein
LAWQRGGSGGQLGGGGSLAEAHLWRQRQRRALSRPKKINSDIHVVSVEKVQRLRWDIFSVSSSKFFWTRTDKDRMQFRSFGQK